MCFEFQVSGIKTSRNRINSKNVNQIGKLEQQQISRFFKKTIDSVAETQTETHSWKFHSSISLLCCPQKELGVKICHFLFEVLWVFHLLVMWSKNCSAAKNALSANEKRNIHYQKYNILPKCNIRHGFSSWIKTMTQTETLVANFLLCRELPLDDQETQNRNAVYFSTLKGTFSSRAKRS